MGEQVNVGEVAVKVGEDIFSHFYWNVHNLRDINFACVNKDHKSDGAKPKSKETHPSDAIFYYDDPYKGIRIYLHTDFKSYGAKTIGKIKLRSAIKSLAMSVECAKLSPDWPLKYGIDEDVNYDIHGLLFVYNHDKKYKEDFKKLIEETDLSTLDIAANVYVHYLDPADINRIWSIANDIIRLVYQKTLPKNYSFYYPELFLSKSHGDVWSQPATIETLCAPYFIIRYPAQDKSPSGFLIYYNRAGNTVEEFEYFLDSLSRYQILNSGEFMRVRMANYETSENFRANFFAARNKYKKAWGFEGVRAEILDGIGIDAITSTTSTYSAGKLGWRDGK